MAHQLFFREWVVIALVLGFIASLTLIAHLSRVRIDQKVACVQDCRPEQIIQLEVIGAVKSPGIYHFPPGINLRKVLKEIPLTSKADRKRINFNKIFYESQKITIPEKQEKI